MPALPEPLASLFMPPHLPDLIQVLPCGDGGYLLRFPAVNAQSAQFPLPTPQMTRFVAAHRYEPFWMKPAVGSCIADIPAETQLLLLELPNDQVALLVPLAGGPDNPWRCSLHSDRGSFCLIADSGTGLHRDSPPPTGDFPGLYIAIAPRHDLHAFLARSARIVAHLLGTTLREQKPLPPFINDFGWCTWDAFYQEVTHDKVREGLDSFRALGITPKFLILDDGWQSEKNFGDDAGRRLTSLLPNDKFSNDLAPTVRMAKDEFGITTFLVWHAFQGYWSGIAPESLPHYHAQNTPRNYSLGILHYLPEFNTKWWGSIAGIIPPDHIAAFFDDYHRTLAAQGVDGVKVDNQAALEAFAALHPAGRAALYQAYHDALEASVATHFSPAQPLINCMSCANDLLYAYRHSPLTRTSADFYPLRPELHGSHLWTNALVATWFGHFIHPDWDMFHSNHSHASFHAAARALSGGPIYVSDKPGHHDPDLLRKLVLSDGAVLRPDRPATLTPDALFTDPTAENSPLKIWTTARNGNAALLGLFNCRHDPAQPLPITATFRPSDIPLLPRADRYAVYAHNAQSLHLLAAADPLSFTLQQAQWELLTLVPITDGIAPLGLLDQFLPPAAILTTSSAPSTFTLTLRDGGLLGFYCESPPVTAHVNGKPAPFHHSHSLLTLTLEPGHPHEVRLTWQ